jgi:quinol monooxygenase YgiN
MSVIVVATLVPLPEHRAEVLAAIEEVIARVHAEDDGCELYAAHEGDDGRVVFIEKWAIAEALAAHGKGAAVDRFRQAIAGRTEGEIDIQVLRPHPAGTAEQGAIL